MKLLIEKYHLVNMEITLKEFIKNKELDRSKVVKLNCCLNGLKDLAVLS